MTAERLERCFQMLARKRPALIIYLTVGDPSIEDSLACALAALDGGADILELGVPFSDPTADGPVIAAASHRAIKAGGSLTSALDVARRLRSQRDAPLILFTYYNPILAFGEERLVECALTAEVDGFLVVDLPPEEGRVLRDSARASELAMIPLVAPTTPRSREAVVLEGARGFAYYVSLTGVTGSSASPLEEAGRAARELALRAKLPVAVGFGIDSPEKAARVARQGVDGVVVGTAVVRAIGSAENTALRAERVRELVRTIRSSLEAASRP